MRKTRIAEILAIIFILLSSISAFAADKTYIYFFYGEECPHCAEEEPWLDEIQEKRGDSLIINRFETWHDTENAEMAEKYRESYKIDRAGVPLTIIGEKYWVGYSETIRDSMNLYLDIVAETGTIDPKDVLENNSDYATEQGEISNIISLPIVGEVNLSNMSLLASTIIIGIVDGVNPCSLWVLTMLLAMIIHTNSRKKALIVGIVYIFVTAGVYALFIIGVFSLFNYMSYMKWVRIAVACITLIMGIINIKDYFHFKQGVSLTISDDKKPDLYKKMRSIITKQDNIFAMIGATIVLALGVSLIEFSCTAAFPVIWSNLLASANVSKAEFAALLFVYMVLYQLDEIIIFVVAVITMKSKRIEEKHGRILKLFSGMLMLFLSVVMIVAPDLMNNILYTIVIFLLAFIVSFVIVIVQNKIQQKQ